MALPTASDNVFPKLITAMQTSDTAAPSDSSWKIYSKANGVYARSSNSIVGPFAAAGAGAGSITASGYTQNTARLLGRTTASAGAIEEITVGTGLSLSAGSLTASATSRYFSRRLTGADFGNANATFGVNSTSYVAWGGSEFLQDWDAFPATHFLISVLAFANEASQTVTLQLAEAATPTTPYSAAGNDLAVVNNGGAVLAQNSGWVAVSGSPTGLKLMVIATKGSTSTVDLTGRWLEIAMKIV